MARRTGATPPKGTKKIRLGISSCLLGERVRYDGGHKHDAYLTDTLGPFVQWVPVCPEVECGLGVPREMMNLVVPVRRNLEKGTGAFSGRVRRPACGPLAVAGKEPVPFSSPRLVTIRTHLDHTDRMLSWARRRVEELAREDLSGFVFKANSPSCGREGVPVQDARGMAQEIGVGLFARLFVERFPRLPVEDDERLHNAVIRANFIERIFRSHL
jgi:uncharacterized protein YbbK (DUF523 family)